MAPPPSLRVPAGGLAASAPEDTGAGEACPADWLLVYWLPGLREAPSDPVLLLPLQAHLLSTGLGPWEVSPPRPKGAGGLATIQKFSSSFVLQHFTCSNIIRTLLSIVKYCKCAL